MHIDKVSHKVTAENRYKTKTLKTQIVLASSLRKSDNHITRLTHKDYGKTKTWNTYTVSREGEVFQHYDDKYHTDFLGIKIGDKQSISIVLENMGYLFETPEGKYVNWLNEVCDPKNVVKRKYVGYDFWEKIPDEQMECVVLLCREVCEKHNIPRVCIDFQHFHKDTSKFRGIVFRSNYNEDSGDFNPLFNISKFNEMLRNEFI